MPKNDDERRSGPAVFWSGTLSFGLVTVPVGLLPANRPDRISLRMLDEDGTPLDREYWCPREERPIEGDEIVRGYEIEPGEFIVVTDEELEGLEPEKSRDIDLREFVERDAVDPTYFERGYFLAPSGDSTKAYRLLAEAMERADRAGIGTFVMRGREYLVAILSENGVLRAETLRFADETRTPEDVGLPEQEKPDPEALREIVGEIGELEAGELDEAELENPEAERLLDLVAKKRESREDVVEAPEPAAPAEDARVMDLMAALQRRMRGDDGGDRSSVGEGDDRPPAGQGDGGVPDSAGEGLETRTKDELYELAREQDIQGRSRMSKQELIRALRG